HTPSPSAERELPHPRTPSPSTGRGLGGGVYHAHLYGTRAHKYTWLDSHDLTTTPWQRLTPQSPFYFFIPRQTQNLEAYQSWASVTEIFQVHHTGIIAGRDSLAIHFSAQELWVTVLQFSRMEPELARQAYQLGKDARDWKVTLAQKDLQRSGPSRDLIKPILYRPFDERYTYYTGQNRGFLRWAYPGFMRHMLAGENMAIIVPRQHKDDFGAFVTKHIGTHKTVAAFDINYYFPLYLYPSTEAPDMFHQARRPNLADGLLPALAAAYGFEPTPEDVLAYIYAVLYSPTYRQKYAQELRTDFPRL
ncbi:MAG: DNA methyltransferase, partial [Moorella sp. (in: Bacteria)]|nr:DNA methyltransferase [Moorella sp. (in: firmicutes)]